MPPNRIELTPVTSSQIEAIGFDEATGTLAVLFKGGGLYHYSGFTPELWDEFRLADSIGSYFHKNIKPNSMKFPYQKQ